MRDFSIIIKAFVNLPFQMLQLCVLYKDIHLCDPFSATRCRYHTALLSMRRSLPPPPSTLWSISENSVLAMLLNSKYILEFLFRLTKKSKTMYAFFPQDLNYIWNLSFEDPAYEFQNCSSVLCRRVSCALLPFLPGCTQSQECSWNRG